MFILIKPGVMSLIFAQSIRQKRRKPHTINQNGYTESFQNIDKKVRVTKLYLRKVLMIYFFEFVLHVFLS